MLARTLKMSAGRVARCGLGGARRSARRWPLTARSPSNPPVSKPRSAARPWPPSKPKLRRARQQEQPGGQSAHHQVVLSELRGGVRERQGAARGRRRRLIPRAFRESEADMRFEATPPVSRVICARGEGKLPRLRNAIPAPPAASRAQRAPALAPALRLGAQPGAGRSHRSGHAALTWSSRATRASWTSCAPSSGFSSATRRASTRCPTGKCCPTTCSRRTRTSFPSASRRWPNCRRLKSAVLLAAADTLGQRLAPRGYVDGRTFNLAVGDRLPLEPLRARLVESGYASVSQVSAPGEFALRGSLFDVFPMGAQHAAAHRPVRRRDRGHPRVRPRDAALGRRRSSRCACCRGANCRWMPIRSRPSGCATASASRATRHAA